MRTIPIMIDSIENMVQSLRYLRMTLAKKPEIHVIRIYFYLALKLMRAQSNPFDGEISDQSQTDNCTRLPMR